MLQPIYPVNDQQSTNIPKALTMDECVDVFQDIVSAYLGRTKLMGEHEGTSRYTEIMTFLVEVISACDRQALGTEASARNIWEQNFASGAIATNVFRRAFIFDVTSEFRIRLGQVQYEQFVKELAFAYSMVDYNRYIRGDSLSVIEGTNASAMSFPVDGLMDNPWFVSFLLLSTVRFTVADTTPRKVSE